MVTPFRMLYPHSGNFKGKKSDWDGRGRGEAKSHSGQKEGKNKIARVVKGNDLDPNLLKGRAKIYI